MNTLVTPSSIHGESLAKSGMTKHQDLIAAMDGIQGFVTFDAPLRELTTLRVGGQPMSWLRPRI